MKKLYKVEEYASDILLLFTPHQPAYIHSVFDNGLNIKVGERLVFIGMTKNGHAPFGIHLNKDSYDELKKELNPTDSIYWLPYEQSFFFSKGKINISYSQANMYPTTFDELANPEEVLKKLESLLISLLEFDRFTGLEIDIEQFVLDFLTTNEASDHNSSLFNYLNLLTESLFHDNLEKTKKALRHLLGRGKGLTPSGDDHVVGLLALQASFRPFSLTFNQAVYELVNAESITTDVSKEYLFYAAQGKFSSSVINLLNQLAKSQTVYQNELDELLKTGHSSGVDTAFGLLLGLLAIRRKNKCQKKS